MVALEVGDWWLEGNFDVADGRLLCQVCLWAALVEGRRDNLEDFLDSLHTFAEVGVLEAQQAAVLAGALSTVELTTAEREDYLPAFRSLAATSSAPADKQIVTSRRAIDLLRGLTSIDDEERAAAARMLSRAASFFSGKGEMRCLARVLLHIAVLEPAGSAARHEQLSTLRFLGAGHWDSEDLLLIRKSVHAGGVWRDVEALGDL